MKKYDTAIIAFVIIIFWEVFGIYFSAKDHEEIMNALGEPKIEYDYSLELRQDDGGCAFIEVRRDSCLFIIHPDSLEEFIIKDNL